MQYPELATSEACHSMTVMNAVAEVSANTDAQRLLRRAAARALGCSSASDESEDLVSEVICQMLGGEIARDDRTMLAQLVAEVAKRGRKQRRLARALPFVPLDEVPDTFLANSDDVPASPPRDARGVVAAVRTLAGAETPWVRAVVLWLLELQLERGTVALDDALAAGLTPYQYRVACQRLSALCHAVGDQSEPAGGPQIAPPPGAFAAPRQMSVVNL